MGRTGNEMWARNVNTKKPVTLVMNVVIENKPTQEGMLFYVG